MAGDPLRRRCPSRRRGWRHLFGASALAGIGFTVSLFVTGLAFEGDDVLGDAAGVGILIVSTVAAALGALLFIVGRTPTSSADD